VVILSPKGFMMIEKAPYYGEATPMGQKAKPKPKSKVKIKRPSRPKSRAIALLLVLPLGWTGVHNFYLGRFWRGIVQFVVFYLSWFVFSGGRYMGSNTIVFLSTTIIWTLADITAVWQGKMTDGQGRTVE
jgi:TM2 domain-containing membrane protein YozV